MVTNIEPSSSSHEIETLDRVERMLHIQNAAIHLEIMMKRARDIQAILEQKQKEELKADA